MKDSKIRSVLPVLIAATLMFPSCSEKSVKPQPSTFTVITPNGGERWLAGSTQEIRWESVNGGDSVVISAMLTQGEVEIAITENDGSYQWDIPNSPSEQCMVGIGPWPAQYRDPITGQPFDHSDSTFEIIAPLKIEGTVYWGSQTLYDVRVFLTTEASYPNVDQFLVAPYETRSAQDGHYLMYIDSLPPRDYYINFAIDDPDFWNWTATPVAVSGGASITQNGFMQKRVTLVGPEPGSLVSIYPMFEWEDFAGAAQYCCNAYRDQSQTATFYQCGLTATKFSSVTPLSNDTRYTWSVEARDMNGISIAYSAYWEFTTEP